MLHSLFAFITTAPELERVGTLSGGELLYSVLKDGLRPDLQCQLFCNCCRSPANKCIAAFLGDGDPKIDSYGHTERISIRVVVKNTWK